MRRHAVALVGATILLVAVPRYLLRDEQTPTASLPIDGLPLRPEPAAAIDGILARTPFEPPGFESHGAPVSVEDVADPDAPDPDAPPQIVGIAGRLPDQAIVLVRRPTGGTRALGAGQSIGRWRLVTIAADAALFSDGTHRVRVELPAGDPPQ